MYTDKAVTTCTYVQQLQVAGYGRTCHNTCVQLYRRAGVLQCWEHLSPTTVAWVWIQCQCHTVYGGWGCGWFFSLFPSPPNQQFQNYISIWSGTHEIELKFNFGIVGLEERGKVKRTNHNLNPHTLYGVDTGFEPRPQWCKQIKFLLIMWRKIIAVIYAISYNSSLCSSHIWFSHIQNFIIILSQVYNKPIQRPAPSWLVSLIGRVLHRCHRGKRIESCSGTSLNFFFQAFFLQQQKLLI